MNRIKTMLIALLIMVSVCATAAADLPATFDWRDVNGTNYVTPVRNQHTCMACWAFAAVGIVESDILINHDYIQDIDLSEQYFISDCWWRGSCYTQYLADSNYRVLYTFRYYGGAPTEECFPYISADTACEHCDEWDHDGWKIGHLLGVGDTTTQYKEKILETGPIMGNMERADWYYPAGPSSGLHAVVIVGWNDSEGCWIVKNSYGTGWGDEGYGKILYGDVEKHGDTWYVTGSYNDNYGPCDAYDTDDNPGIQFDELMAAMQDFFNGIITIDTYNEVHACYVACNPCEAYDTNNDDIIQFDEMMAAMQDYFNDIISIDTFNAVLDCYNA